MSKNPMHQFEVYRLGPEINLGSTNLSFTNASLTCVLTYSKITNKITLTAGSGVAIVLNASSTALGLIGFHSNGVLSGTTTLVSSQGVNVNPIRNVYVKLQNLNIRNRYNKSTSKVIAKVPIDVERNGVVFYTAMEVLIKR